MLEGPDAMKGFTFYLIFQQFYEIEIQVGLAAETKAFLRAVSPLNLHGTVPDVGNPHQGWLHYSSEEFLMFEEFTFEILGSVCFPLTSYEIRGTVWTQGISYEQRDTAESELVVDFMSVRS